MKQVKPVFVCTQLSIDLFKFCIVGAQSLVLLVVRGFRMIDCLDDNSDSG